jgi:hypothetical protein
MNLETKPEFEINPLESKSTTLSIPHLLTIYLDPLSLSKPKESNTKQSGFARISRKIKKSDIKDEDKQNIQVELDIKEWEVTTSL